MRPLPTRENEEGTQHLQGTFDDPDWKAEAPAPRKAFEVIRVGRGCSDSRYPWIANWVDRKKRKALQSLLDAHGSDIYHWVLVPEIRDAHHHEVGVCYTDYGRTLHASDHKCSWAAYGRVMTDDNEPPALHYIEEGVCATRKTNP